MSNTITQPSPKPTRKVLAATAGAGAGTIIGNALSEAFLSFAIDVVERYPDLAFITGDAWTALWTLAGASLGALIAGYVFKEKSPNA